MTKIFTTKKHLNLNFPAPKNEDQALLLGNNALEFLICLVDRFQPRIEKLLLKRNTIQEKLNQGYNLKFLENTKHIRDSKWSIAPLRNDLSKRHVEITGPVERKMIINALNSGADVFMADFEDSNSPTWDNIINGHVNLCDATRKTITYFNESKNKTYKLNKNIATLFVRPRGLHLVEKHITLNGKSLSASLVDFGLYFFHNGCELFRQNKTPAFYLPKLENHEEARLWADIFKYSENALGAPDNIIKATVLIETITAAFEMDEILYELRNYSAGLNCGRWDYIFSFIKKHRNNPNFVMPNRTDVTMTKHNMSSYAKLLVKTCHLRGAQAIGGMSAFIPVKNNEEKNTAALNAVTQDKLTEVNNGHDGTWVAHPGLVGLAKDIFEKNIDGDNQITNSKNDINLSAQDLLVIPEGNKTLDEIKNNIDISLIYMFNWINGTGCVPINDLMEDAATVEISRTLIWQWVKHNVTLDDGTDVTSELITNLIDTQSIKIAVLLNVSQTDYRYNNVVDVLKDACTNVNHFHEFITTQLYHLI